MSIEKNILMSSLLDEYSSLLSENQKQIMEEYFFQDRTLSEIALNFSISRQAVLDAIKKAEERLTDYEDKLNLASIKGSLRKIVYNSDHSNLTKEQIIDYLKTILKE